MAHELFSTNEIAEIKDTKLRALAAITACLPDFVGGWSEYSDHIVVAGGVFTSLILSEPIKDIDIFILDDEHTRTWVDRIFKESTASAIIHSACYFPNNKNIIGTITVCRDRKYPSRQSVSEAPYVIQFIYTKYKTRQELLKDFDMEHTVVSLQMLPNKDFQIYLSRDTYDCIKNKIIKHHNPNDIAEWRFKNMMHRKWRYLARMQKIEVISESPVAIGKLEVNGKDWNMYGNSPIQSLKMRTMVG